MLRRGDRVADQQLLRADQRARSLGAVAPREPTAADQRLRTPANARPLGASRRASKDGPRVAVYGWPGSRALARRGDEVVFDGRGVAVPSLPATMSMRDFVRRTFGGPGAS